MKHYFCLSFQGNLENIFGKEICFELEECTRISSIIEKILVEKKAGLSINDLLLTVNGRNISLDEDTCSVSRVEVYRLLQGG